MDEAQLAEIERQVALQATLPGRDRLAAFGAALETITALVAAVRRCRGAAQALGREVLERQAEITRLRAEHARLSRSLRRLTDGTHAGDDDDAPAALAEADALLSELGEWRR